MQQHLHRYLYYVLQALRSRPIGYLIHRLQEWDALDADAYRQLARNRLAAMLAHAGRNVPFYAAGAWARARRGRDAADIGRWPVLERRDLIEHRRELIAAPLKMRLVMRQSSASTGTPVRVGWNRLGLAWSWAAEYHAMRWHGIEIGVKTLRLWGSSHRLENWVLNRCFVPADALTRAELERALRYLKTEHPQLVWGLPSAVVHLARFVARHGGASPPRVPYVKVGGEQVYPFQREEISRELGARVIEAYGCTEVGPVAAECPAGSMHVLSANVHVEIFRNGCPVSPGEFGDIVVTTLVNKGMPLVRYRVGDSGRLVQEPCICGLPQPALTDLRGRNSDLLLAVDGAPVHASVLGQALHRYTGKPPLGYVEQLLFEQIDRQHWRVQIESPQTNEQTALAEQLNELLRDTFGEGCEADIVVVPRIKVEPSGKFRYYRAPSGMDDALRRTH